MVSCSGEVSALGLLVSCDYVVEAETYIVGTEHTASQAVVPELTSITLATLHNPGVAIPDFGATRLAGTEGTV